VSRRRASPASGVAVARAALVAVGVASIIAVTTGGCGVDGAAADVAGGDGADAAADAAVPLVDVAVAPASLVLGVASPFSDVEGAPIVPCGPGGVVVEGTSLEIRTVACDPADVGTVLPTAIPAGTIVDLTASHAALVADGGEAHLALFVGDELAWEHRVPLPAPATFLAPRITLARAHAAGEPVVFHVHNHGSNVYALHGLRLHAPAR